MLVNRKYLASKHFINTNEQASIYQHSTQYLSILKRKQTSAMEKAVVAEIKVQCGCLCPNDFYRAWLQLVSSSNLTCATSCCLNSSSGLGCSSFGGQGAGVLKVMG